MPVEKNVGVGKPFIITGRAAKLGNSTQGRIQGGQYQLFPARKTIQKGDCKGITFNRCQPCIATGAQQPVNNLLRVLKGKAFKLADQCAVDGEVPGIKAQGADTAPPIAFAGNFTSRCTTNHPDARKCHLERGPEAGKVVLHRTEKKHAARSLMAKLAGKRGSRTFGTPVT